MIKQIIIDENSVVQACSIGGYIANGIDVDDIPQEVMECPNKFCYIEGAYVDNVNYVEPTEVAAEPTEAERLELLETAVQDLILMQMGGE